ncbi:MAG: hypothetical protein R3A48_01635 [Polyangiales bacterium]
MRRASVALVALALLHEALGAYVASHPLTAFAGGGGLAALLCVAAALAFIAVRLALLVAAPGLIAAWVVRSATRRRGLRRG